METKFGAGRSVAGAPVAAGKNDSGPPATPAVTKTGVPVILFPALINEVSWL